MITFSRSTTDAHKDIFYFHYVVIILFWPWKVIWGQTNVKYAKTKKQTQKPSYVMIEKLVLNIMVFLCIPILNAR